MQEKKRPLRCRLGLHLWVSDSAFFTCAEQCRRCLTYKNPTDQRRLERERKLWEEEPTGNYFKTAAIVKQKLDANPN